MALSSLGVQLVENFKLLLELVPDEDCSKYVNERMFLTQDRHVFHKVMTYIIRLIDTDHKSSIPSQLLTKQDERTFNNSLCEHLRTLRMEYPEINLPLLTPSSLVYFHGDKCRGTLLKITDAVMLKIMKDDNFDIDVEIGAQENNVDEFERLCFENSKLRDQLENIDQNNAKEVSRRVNILNLIVSTGPWDETTKLRLMDINDSSIISEIKNMSSKLESELSILKENILPYLQHINHEISGEECQCDPSYNLSSSSVSDICEVMWDFTKKGIEAHIRNLRCISIVKTWRWEEEKDILENLEFSDKVSSELIKHLENMIGGHEEGRLNVTPMLLNSPITLATCSPSGYNTSFSPINTSDWLNFKKQATQLNVTSLADYFKPVKVSVSPVDPFNFILPRATKKKPASNESLTTIVQRMRLKATPSKFSNNSNSCTFSSISSSLFSKASMSASKVSRNFEKCTPVSKHSEPLVSQSTNRRQSMGFVKPSTCYVRKQLNPPCIFEKRVSTCSLEKRTENICSNGFVSKESFSHKPVKEPSTPVSRKPLNGQSPEKREFLHSGNKSDKACEVNNGYSDEVFDMIARKMIEEESSFSGNTSDVLDFSLSGVECLPPSPFDETKLQKSENDEVPQELQQLTSPQKTTNISTVIAEMIEEQKEIDRSLNCDLDDNVSTIYTDSDSSDESEVFLDPIKVSKETRKSITQKLPELTRKTARGSLGLLIERYKAIKKQSEANGK